MDGPHSQDLIIKFHDLFLYLQFGNLLSCLGGKIIKRCKYGFEVLSAKKSSLNIHVFGYIYLYI